MESGTLFHDFQALCVARFALLRARGTERARLPTQIFGALKMLFMELCSCTVLDDSLQCKL